MLQGFFLESSAFPGDSVSLRVATDVPQFRVEIFRHGATFDLVLPIGWQDGSKFPGEDHAPDDDWSADGRGIDANGFPQGFAAAWQGLTIRIPEDWSSGVYIAVLVPGDGNGNDAPPAPDLTKADARNGNALLVVKNPRPGISSQLLYKVPLFTYQSYNSVNKYLPLSTGGFQPSSIYQWVDVSLRRPGGGTGGTPWDVWNFDPWDNLPAGSPRQTFQHWDAKLISWLEALGYRIDYCTDLDVHLDDSGAMLSSYSVILSVGHDEYYSAAMRSNLESFLAAGGNIAFFSGNTCWWRTELDPERPYVMHGQQTIQNWNQITPEDSLTGVSFRNGGEGNENRPAIGYVVQNTNQWPFEATALEDGDEIGTQDGLVGYECDGAPYDKNAPLPRRPLILAGVGTPTNLMILGTADVNNLAPNGNGGATMAMHGRNGTVFTAATTDWPRVAAQGDPRVGMITRNVIDRFGGNPKGLSDLGGFDPFVACDGFYSEDDGFRHAIVGAENGQITEIFFNPQVGLGRTVLSELGPLLDLSAFYTPDDRFRHVLVILQNGDLREVFFSPVEGLGVASLASLPGATRVNGFFSADDGFRHAVVSDQAGDIFEVFYSPNSGVGQVKLGSFANVVDVGSFFSDDDGYRHAIIGTADGNVTEIFFHPEFGSGQTVIGNFPDLERVSAYYIKNDRFFNRRVQVIAQGGRLFEIRYHPNFGVMRALLMNTSNLTDLGGFYSSDDDFRHSIIADGTSVVQELFFKP